MRKDVAQSVAWNGKYGRCGKINSWKVEEEKKEEPTSAHHYLLVMARLILIFFSPFFLTESGHCCIK